MKSDPKIYREEVNEKEADMLAGGLTIADNLVGVALMLSLLILFL
ncbi:MAG: hypothetical protein AAGA60_11430 [Cyanobacteria bacterium P01_E01_bin.42]